MRVRFAPSPTGFVHIGSLRTALYCYLLAKKENGSFLLRIEDTDQTRFVEGAIEGVLDAMAWAGIAFDEGVQINQDHELVSVGEYGPYIQSERLDIYQEYIQTLLDNDSAYYCFCTQEELDQQREEQKSKGMDPKYNGKCRHLTQKEVADKLEQGMPHVIRMKLPKDTDIEFEDEVRGKVTINTNDMDDQVLMKSDGFPTYHFAVVVDDHLMKISHVIRGEEWLPSTPKQVFLYQAFDWELPKFIHCPNILNTNKKKLSKRQGDVAVEDFRKKGYLPEALVNYVALVGWSPEDNHEFFTMQELIESFSIEHISKSGGVFDVQKLNHFNNHYLKIADIERLVTLAKESILDAELMSPEEVEKNHDWLVLALETLRDRLDNLSQFPEEIKILLSDEVDVFESEALTFIEQEHMAELNQSLIEMITELEEVTPDDFSAVLKIIQKEKGIKGKSLFMGTRILISGQNHGPDLPVMATLIGKEKLLSRLQSNQESFFA